MSDPDHAERQAETLEEMALEAKDEAEREWASISGNPDLSGAWTWRSEACRAGAAALRARGEQKTIESRSGQPQPIPVADQRADHRALVDLAKWIEFQYSLAEQPKVHTRTNAGDIYAEIVRRIGETQ